MSSHSPDGTSLVGRAIVASVGEPWDFHSAAGDNLLTGQIAATSAPGEAPSWLLCDVSPFVLDGHTISMAAAVRRYADEEPSQRLRAHGETHANLMYDPSGAPLTPDRVRAALALTGADARDDTFRFLVASLRLA